MFLNYSGSDMKAYVRASGSAIAFYSSASAEELTISLTSNMYKYIDGNTIYTLAYDPKNYLAYFGFYVPVTSKHLSALNEIGATASSIGRVFSATGQYFHGLKNKFSGLYIDYHANDIIHTIGIKTYNEDLVPAAMSAMTMNPNSFLYNGSYPSH